jgi:Rrf2 family transcriptional regulator, cysteine metabolism repressor
MLSLTTKAHYGVAAILDLAFRYDQGLVQIKDIVARQNIPRNYLEQLLNLLQKSGLIRSVRGKQGGYELAFPPSKITLLDLIETLEGKIGLSEECRIESVNDIYRHLAKVIRKELTIPLSEIIEKEEKSSKVPMFYI